MRMTDRRFVLAFSTVALLASMAHAQERPAPKLASASVRLATPAEGAAILRQRDGFVAALSAFDRAARLKTDQPVSEAEYLRFIGAQTQPFSEDERRRLGDGLRGLDEKLGRLFRTLPLPRELVIVKTNGLEEGQAAYCRGNAIVLPAKILDSNELAPTLAHELFHVISTQDPALRRKLYALVGFQPGAEVALPASLRTRKITNPDAYRNDYRIRVRVDGKSVEAVPVLYAAAEHYDPKRGGEFFEYLTFKLLLTDGTTLVDPASVPDYATQLGGNTDYVIHPEEVLADCFRLLVAGSPAVASPALLERIRAVFQAAPAKQ